VAQGETEGDFLSVLPELLGQDHVVAVAAGAVPSNALLLEFCKWPEGIKRLPTFG